MSQTSTKKWVFYAIMIGVQLAVVLGCFFGYYTYKTYKQPFAKAVYTQTRRDFEPDKEMGYAYRKNLKFVEHSEDGEFAIFTDSRGARIAEGDPDYTQADILVVGCSFTSGYRVPLEFTFSRIMQKALGRPVANMGVPSYGSVQALQSIKRHLDLKPKLVIYPFINDHIWRNLSPSARNVCPLYNPVAFIDFRDGQPFMSPPQFEKGNTDYTNKFLSEVYFQKGWGINDVLWRIRIDWFNLPMWQDIQVTEDEAVHQRSLEFIFAEMKKTTEASGARLVVVFLPLFGEKAFGPPVAPYLNAVKSQAIETIDLTPEVKAHYQNPGAESLSLIGDPSHPNALGNQLIAQKLLQEIEARNLLGQ